MHFLSTQYKKFATIATWQRYLITLCMITLLVGSWYVFMYQPIKNHIMNYEKEKKCSLECILSLKKLQSQQSELIHSITRLKNQMQEYIPKIKRSEYLQTFADYVQQSHLCIENCLLEQTQNCNWHSMQRIKLESHGMLSQLINFLNDLGQHASLILTEQMHLSLMQSNLMHITCLLSDLRLH